MSVSRLLNGSTDLATLLLPNGNPLIDLHSGGEDNIFPHHECEIAQSCCAFNADPGKGSFAAMWFHPRFLLVEGTKMSKSKGNFFTARDLFAKGIEPAALRLELIKTHYRSNANFTMQGLVDSQRTIERWRRFLLNEAGGFVDAPANAAFPELVSMHMENDLNVAAAIASLNEYVNDNPKPEPWQVRQFSECESIFGVLSLSRPAATHSDIGLFAPGVPADPAVESLLRQRRDARAAKDFKASDAIRDQLAAMGYAIKDAKDGKVEVSRK
jgi:cysteinyl-tRNA synthetase